MRSWLLWAVLATVPYLLLSLTPTRTPLQQKWKTPDFGVDVLPVLKGRCGTCHSGDSPSGDLDLTNGASILKAGVVTPGKPDDSTLVKRLLGLGGLPRMPKGFAPLDPEQIETIKAWIAAGASIKETQHWSFRPIAAPTTPLVKGKSWVRNPVDSFVLGRLEAEGLSPSPEASRETLIRRVSLDLTGLPPTLDEVDAFVRDKSPNAYEKVVDRLLASPHYGERQARVWLDLARYADTNGYEADRGRTAYLYRDWVIQAFNSNMPFDRFTIEQLAGDLLPNATLAQKVATGFHRNSMFNEEGGVDPRESMFETILDRVSTTGTVWLGLTVGCARCHDHKFDPITQKDFYRMYAFFSNNVYESRGDASVGQEKYYEPVLRAPTPEQEKQEESLKKRLAEIDRKLSIDPPESEIENWRKRWGGGGPWKGCSSNLSVKSGSPADARPDASYLIGGPAPAQDRYTISIDLPEGTWTGLGLDVLPDPSLRMKGPGKASSGNFILSKVELSANGKPILFSAAADFVQDGYDLAGLQDNNGDTGWAIYPQQGLPHLLVLSPEKAIRGPAKISLMLDMSSPSWPEHVIGCFRVMATQSESPKALAFAEDARALFAKRDLTSDEGKRVVLIYKSRRPSDESLRKERTTLQKSLDELQRSIPSALVMQDKPIQGPLVAAVHIRGEFLRTGDTVAAGTLSALPTSKDEPGNRLGLAKWLVGQANPLTARVQVNRLWEQYFGRGLVETSEDFGTQGSRPTHPELLDFLAYELQKKWDLKAIHRLIVTSATYKQSSVASKELRDRDPANELLARGPRFRMEAEMIRDAALASAGLLNTKVGGPSVFPSQPDGIWNSPYSGEQWMSSTGVDRYRRGLYTYWKRTSPYPSFVAFDAASRETCVVRRVRTNTPLQALAMMNDKAMYEAAGGLAERMGKGADDGAKVRLGFRLVTSRVPTKDEEDRLIRLLRTMREKVGVKDREVRALTLVANVLLNLDEFLTKG